MHEDQVNDRTLSGDERGRGEPASQRRLSPSSGRRLSRSGTPVGPPRAFPRAADPSGSFAKPTPPEHFILHGRNAEMRWEIMRERGYRVANELFFVRNHTATPYIDLASWRLRIEGSGVERSLDLTYDDLLAMEAVTESKFIECAGNGRRFFNSQQGRQSSGTPWGLGAIGVAEWRGVRLREVLERAGLRPTAVDVMAEGLDAPVSASSGHVRRPLPIGKALEDDTLLVYGMNGEPLPPDHGFPLRLLVPGWVGIANIKWVGRIEVAEEPLFSPWNTTSYRYFGEAYPDAPLLSTQPVKSALELPFPAQLRAGPQWLQGRAWSGLGPIERVEASFDGGVSWREAQLEVPNLPGAWVRWKIRWDAPPGEHLIKIRATDQQGNVQPAQVPHNEQGYLFWAVVDHPVMVL